MILRAHKIKSCIWCFHFKRRTDIEKYCEVSHKIMLLPDGEKDSFLAEKAMSCKRFDGEPGERYLLSAVG